MTMSHAHGYDQDFHDWLTDNARFMRNHQWDQVDVEHLAEELEAMAKGEKRELLSRLSVLLMHLLKWQYQPPMRTRSWRNTIATQRIDIQELLIDSPSLKPYLNERLEAAYTKAKLKAENETGIDQQRFPLECPYTVEDLLSADFFPES
jgi:hypothetical protein